jgi:hypothetical protein
MSNILVAEDHSLSAGRTRALNGAVGGQQGAMSDPRNWMSSATYVKQKLIPVLIEAPGHMTYMDNGADRIKILKALVELMATSITGLTSTLEVEYGEHRVSNAGEFHETMTNVNRARSVPSFVWPEKEGMAVYNFFNDWIVELLADPETMHPGLVNKTAYQEAGYPEFLPDAISMTVLFIEPSRDLKRITNAWLCTNMMPKSSGTNEGSRVIGEANETVEQTIEFTATTQIGKEVIRLAQTYLDELNKTGFQPAALPAAYEEISADVNVDSESYKTKVEQVADAAASQG